MFFELTHYIEYLEAKEDLVRIKEFVSTDLEISEIVDRVSKSEGGGKALLFENNGTAFPLLINAWGSDSRIAAALGVKQIEDVTKEIESLFREMTMPRNGLWEKLKMLPKLKEASLMMPKISNTKKPACREVVMPTPKLSDLPVLKCWPFDGGPFITLPMVHTKSLENGMRNVGMYRMQVYDDCTTGMHWHRHKTGAKHFEEYKKAGQIMPIAVTLGGDPTYTWCATAPMPENIDEYLLAGFLRKKPVKLVKCLTQDIEVPEDADIVIEGYVDPAESFRMEGPFGDHTGFYSLADLYPVFHVTCITHKNGAIYPATLVGIPPQEDVYMAKATERIFLSPIKIAIAPEMHDMYLPEEGVAHNIAIVSIKKSYPGQASKVADALWGAGQMMFCKSIIVVDHDVDVRNINSVVETAIRNWTPAADTFFGKGPSDVLDHAAQQPGYGGKICIDATVKLPEEQADAEILTDKYENLFTAVHKSKYNPAYDYRSKAVVIFDDETDLSDYETCTWITGSHTDFARDCSIQNGVLFVDATVKTGKNFHRPWPNPVCMSDDVIAKIDNIWDKLKIGKFIPSPSLQYKHLVKSEGAVVSVENI